MKNLLLIACVFLGGCVSLPKETVLLSSEMGIMLVSAKSQHMALLDQYEKERRARIDDYMQTTGIPDILTPMTVKGDLWGKTCAVRNTPAAVNELSGFVLAAAQAIAELRKELTDALDEVMAEQRSAANEYYDTLILSNKAVTGNLQALQANQEVTSNTLKMFKADPKNLVPLKAESKKLDALFKK